MEIALTRIQEKSNSIPDDCGRGLTEGMEYWTEHNTFLDELIVLESQVSLSYIILNTRA